TPLTNTFHSWYNQFLKRNFKEQQRKGKVSSLIRLQVKLNRRQKAYDSIRSELDPPPEPKLSRQCSIETTPAQTKRTLRQQATVLINKQPTSRANRFGFFGSELIWESEELRQLKNRLDSVAAASAPVVRRQSGVYSDRPAPVYDATASSAPVLPFSALTLFESTLLNAGMLLDSMSMDELLGAMRLTANLHIQLIGAMQPCATDLQRKLNNLDSNNAPTTTDTTASNDNEQTINRHGNIGNENSDENSDSLSRGQLNSIPSLKRRLSTDREVVCPVKLERHADADDDEELAEPPTNGGIIEEIVALKRLNLLIRLNTIVIIDDDDDEDDDAGLVDEDCPTMTDAGPSSVSMTFGSLIMQQHQQQHQQIPGSVVEMHKNRINVGGTAHMRKLGRRQKAFEALLPSLTPDELEQYRVVLTRDVTSSDEEDEDETLRVRDLPWQSDRMREMKQRLDEAFTLRFATIKQRCQLAKCVRHPEV
uniref:DH domain-containing protein n=1 Tax=Macrostomum lignano TaxID=282301 RepID=A0A1I8FF90_9PLAT